MKGWTPLHYACCLKWEVIASNNVYDWNTLNEFEKEKYHETYKEIIIKIVNLFIENSKDINQISNDHKTALSLAIANENFEVAELFLNHPSFDVFKISQAESCIYHDLASVLIKEKGRQLFYKVVDLMGHRTEEFINMIEHFGYSPILSFIQSYTLSSVKLII